MKHFGFPLFLFLCFFASLLSVPSFIEKDLSLQKAEADSLKRINFTLKRRLQEKDTLITELKEKLEQDTLIVKDGGSLSGLGIPEKEAFELAQKFNIPNWYNASGKYVVHVKVGDKFYNGLQPDTLRYLKK